MWVKHTLFSLAGDKQTALALVAVVVGIGACHRVRRRLCGTGTQVAAVVLSGLDSVGRVVLDLGSVSQRGGRRSG